MWDLVVAPAGGGLASLGTDGEVLLWNTASLTPVGAPLVPHGTAGWGWLDWRGDRLDVLSQLSTAASYDLSLTTLLGRACAVAGPEPTSAEWEEMHGDAVQRPTCGDLPSRDLLAS